MTIIEVPENYRWEINSRPDRSTWASNCMRQPSYYLSYQMKTVSVREVYVRGKFWLFGGSVQKITQHNPERDWVALHSVRLPDIFDEKIIRDHAWILLYELAMREPVLTLDRFIGTYPPKTLD